MTEQTYRLTASQLNKALLGAIDMYAENRDVHELSPPDARLSSAGEILEGLDADQELAANDPTERLKLQLPDAHEDLLAAAEATLDYWRTTDFADCEPGCTCIVDQMRAAIKKARGQSS